MPHLDAGLKTAWSLWRGVAVRVRPTNQHRQPFLAPNFSDIDSCHHDNSADADRRQVRKRERDSKTPNMAAKPIIQGQEFPVITPTAIKDLEEIPVEVDERRVRVVRPVTHAAV
jgi:hypothetical protein